jgi:hypothetical protein
VSIRQRRVLGKHCAGNSRVDGGDDFWFHQNICCPCIEENVCFPGRRIVAVGAPRNRHSISGYAVGQDLPTICRRREYRPLGLPLNVSVLFVVLRNGQRRIGRIVCVPKPRQRKCKEPSLVRVHVEDAGQDRFSQRRAVFPCTGQCPFDPIGGIVETETDETANTTTLAFI